VGTGADPQANIDYGSLADKTFAAMGVLRTITTLIMNLENSPDTVAQLETHLIPLVGFTLQQELVDLYDDVFEIIDSCTFTLKRISPAMWTLLPLIHKTFDGEGFDYFDVMLPTLDNYVSYGTEQVASNAEILQLLMHFYQRIMQSERSNEQERTCGCKLVEALMLNCRGRIDGLIPEVIQHAMRYIATPGGIKSRGFLVYALEVVLNALYYNPQLALGVLEQHGWTQGYFGRLTQSVDKFKRVHDKKLLIAALCAVIAMPSSQLPGSIQGGLAELFGTLLRTFETLPRAFDNRAHQEGKFSLEELSGSEDDIDADLDDLDDF
ncbi:Nonsense-mediated mRNA decay protein 5, partial [Dimargaris verticillata]